MKDTQQLPVALKVVAVLFIVGGIIAVIDVLGALGHSHLNITLGVLGLFIAPGILALRPGWRTCALVFLWIAVIGIPIAVVFMLGHSGPLNFRAFGQTVGHTSKEPCFAIAAVLFLLALWQYRVLTRPDVRTLSASRLANRKTVVPKQSSIGLPCF